MRKQSLSEAEDYLDWLENNPSTLSTNDGYDVEEFAVLLRTSEVRELIDQAQQQGLSAAGLARHLICDYLHWISSDFGRSLRRKLGGLQPGETS
jgi:hypothetical protein